MKYRPASKIPDLEAVKCIIKYQHDLRELMCNVIVAMYTPAWWWVHGKAVSDADARHSTAVMRPETDVWKSRVGVVPPKTSSGPFIFI